MKPVQPLAGLLLALVLAASVRAATGIDEPTGKQDLPRGSGTNFAKPFADPSSAGAAFAPNAGGYEVDAVKVYGGGELHEADHRRCAWPRSADQQSHTPVAPGHVDDHRESDHPRQRHLETSPRRPARHRLRQDRDNQRPVERRRVSGVRRQREHCRTERIKPRMVWRRGQQFPRRYPGHSKRHQVGHQGRRAVRRGRFQSHFDDHHQAAGGSDRPGPFHVPHPAGGRICGERDRAQRQCNHLWRHDHQGFDHRRSGQVGSQRLRAVVHEPS